MPPGNANSPHQLFEQGLRLHQEGQLAQAAGFYEQAIAADPAHFDALHLLGVIAAQSGDAARAVALIDRAIAVDAQQAPAHYHRALALRDQGLAPEALHGFAAALKLDPDHFDAWLAQAETLQAMGHPTEAVQSYGRLLDLQPHHAQALFARGTMLQQLQQQEAALTDYEAVLTLQPDFPGAINNRALALQALQCHAQAAQGFAQLLTLVPGHVPAQLGLARSLRPLGRHEEALQVLEDALRLQPDDADALLERARAMRALGRADAADTDLARLLERCPARIDGWFEQASLRQTQGRHADALASLNRTLVLQPAFAEALIARAMSHAVLGHRAEALRDAHAALALAPANADLLLDASAVLDLLGDYAASLVQADAALARRPDDARGHLARALALEHQRRFPECLASHRAALALEPDNIDALFGCGVAAQETGQAELALGYYERTLALAPGRLDGLANQAAALRKLKRDALAIDSYARLLALDPDHPNVRGDLLHAQRRLCDWRGESQLPALLKTIAQDRPGCLPFDLLALTDSGDLQRRCAAVQTARSVSCAEPAWHSGPRAAGAEGARRIRVGYVSADLKLHPVSYLMVGMLEMHDRDRFEIFAFALAPIQDSPFEQRVRAAFDHFIDISGMDDAGAAQLMREHGIDIAIDMMGHTDGTRPGIFARRPAPVQAAYLGFAATTATPGIDYLITDAIASPTETAAHYTESLVHLPPSFMPRDTRLLPGPAPTRASQGLPEQGFVFCCFNNAYKLNPPVFDVWMRLLQKVPGSVLWLNVAEPARGNLRREAQLRGVDATRLIFASIAATTEQHLGRIGLADLFLDTLPYNAHTTASDALYAGVPLLTCAGEAMASRVAASLLHAAGLPQMVTHSLAEYEALALTLTRDDALLAGMRARLEQQRAQGTLFDPRRLCRHLEAAFARMVERDRAGLPPAAITIPG